MFLSSEDGYVRQHLELPQGCQGHFRASRRKVGFLSRCHNGKRPHLAWREESLVFLEMHQVHLKLQWIPQGPARVASGKSSLHTSYEGCLGIPLWLHPGPRSSSGVEARTSGFLSRADMDLGISLEFPQGGLASSHVEICKSALLSSWKSSVRFPVGLT